MNKKNQPITKRLLWAIVVLIGWPLFGVMLLVLAAFLLASMPVAVLGVLFDYIDFERNLERSGQ